MVLQANGTPGPLSRFIESPTEPAAKPQPVAFYCLISRLSQSGSTEAEWRVFTCSLTFYRDNELRNDRKDLVPPVLQHVVDSLPSKKLVGKCHFTEPIEKQRQVMVVVQLLNFYLKGERRKDTWKQGWDSMRLGQLGRCHQFRMSQFFRVSGRLYEPISLTAWNMSPCLQSIGNDVKLIDLPTDYNHKLSTLEAF